MHEAFQNWLLDVRWEDAPLGSETARLVLRLRECGHAERPSPQLPEGDSRWHARQDIIQWLAQPQRRKVM